MQRSFAIALVTVIALAGAITSNDLIQGRIQSFSKLFSGDYQLTNAAIGKRLDLWNTSLNMFQENWINGVGPRGFRYVYTTFSSPDDHFYNTGQTHPHQLVLEVLVETGVIGGAGLLLFIIVLPLSLYKHKVLLPVFPYLLAIFVSIFPLNTHMAFYGSYWSSLFWWLVILLIAAANIYTKQFASKKCF